MQLQNGELLQFGGGVKLRVQIEEEGLGLLNPHGSISTGREDLMGN